MKRFEAEAIRTKVQNDDVLLVLLMAGIREGTPFWYKIQENEPKTLKAFHKMAAKWKGIETTEALR